MKTFLIYVDHGLMIGNFIYTGLAEKLTAKGIRLVFLVQDELIQQMQAETAGNDLIVFESSREEKTASFQNHAHPTLFGMLEYLRGSSMSPRIPLTYVDTDRRRKEFRASGTWKITQKVIKPLIYLLRNSKMARRIFVPMQTWFFQTCFFADLFDKYQPDMVISSTAGWRLDRYFLREARKRGIPSTMIVIGWDNPSAFGLPGARVDYASVWSTIHIRELSEGIDWPIKNLYVGGFPLYDGYINKSWQLPREKYFALHNLDPEKKLIVFAATALSISPNLHIIEELTRIITEQRLTQHSQLLIRLHPNHFKPQRNYQEERERIYEVTKNCPDVHVVAPKALSGGLPRYSGEDFPEKASMLAHCDVMTSIYSTMVLEATLHDKPVVSICVDSQSGWPDNFWVPLHEVPFWPTAARVNQEGAGRNAFTTSELISVLNEYLEHPELDRENRRKFTEQELTFLNGEATGETANYLLRLTGISE